MPTERTHPVTLAMDEINDAARTAFEHHQVNGHGQLMAMAMANAAFLLEWVEDQPGAPADQEFLQKHLEEFLSVVRYFTNTVHDEDQAAE